MLTIVALFTLGLADDPPVDYVRQVKPLLARHCVLCHGADKPRAGLRLDTAAGAKTGGASGPAVVDGAPEESLLLLAVEEEDFSRRMPLKRPPLPRDEIATLRAWIAQGAGAPEDETPSPRPDGSQHWAFQQLAEPALPDVRDAAWCRNSIDRFILARLDAEGMTPSPQAERAVLIRRLSLDLIGLPPTPREVELFLDDERPDAYERLVDRLLASPHYGERWARPWLDMARYADSNGYSIDAPRTIWPYRDWVVQALNADMPFDEFGMQQLAGDLVPGATLDTRVATGFHRNTPINQEGGIDREQFRVESIIDRVNTTGTVFLGLTIGCAQCHDHKYDPISQKEYYQLFAFFNNVDEPEMPVAEPEAIAHRDRAEQEASAFLDALWRDHPDLKAQVKAWELSLDMAGRQKQSQAVREAFDVPFDTRPDAKQRVVFEAYIDQAEPARADKVQLDAIRGRAPKLVTTMVVQERIKNPRSTHVLIKGDFTRPGDAVRPEVPKVLPPLSAANGGATRLDLARWLFQPAHPLTARVAVNRMWQGFFGRGLVETENDFGVQGAPPSHPELLDWLARSFIESGFRQKEMHRLIVTSMTYRQSSSAGTDAHQHDPNNRLLGRQQRLRLEAEQLRDSALHASGLLSRAMGGPGVFPPQPDGVMNLGQMRREWTADTGPNRRRRALYTYVWRATPHPLLTVFDGPDPARSCTRRERSNTPLQALILLNDEAFLECARALADAASGPVGSSDDERIDQLFQRCLARRPDEAERSQLRALVETIRASRADRDGERAAWVAAARVLLNLDEFLTRE